MKEVMGAGWDHEPALQALAPLHSTSDVTPSLCLCQHHTPPPVQPATSSPALMSTTHPVLPPRRPCLCAWADAGSALGVRCTPPCSSSPGSSPSTGTTAPWEGYYHHFSDPTCGSPPSLSMQPATTPRARHPSRPSGTELVFQVLGARVTPMDQVTTATAQLL